MGKTSCICKTILSSLLAILLLSACQSMPKGDPHHNKKYKLTSEQAEALKRLNEEIVLLLVKKMAIVSVSQGKPMPEIVSGPLDNLVVDTSKEKLPTITTTEFKKDEEIEYEIVVEIGPISLYFPDEDVCEDGQAQMSCKGECPCN